MNWKNRFFCIQNLKFAFFYQSFYHSKAYSVNKWDMQQHHTTPALLNVWVWNKSALQFFGINAPNVNWINRKMSGRYLKKLTKALVFSFWTFFSKKIVSKYKGYSAQHNEVVPDQLIAETAAVNVQGLAEWYFLCTAFFIRSFFGAFLGFDQHQ